MLDIIIPVLNEEQILKSQEDYYLGLKRKARVIFVDGGSHDKTVELASRYGTVVASETGRAFQKNKGAQVATSQALLFIHVDACLDKNSLESIEEALASNQAKCGCLQMKIDDKGMIFRIYERIVNFRARRFGIMDGDLGLFIRKDLFNKLGRFDQIPVMEDLRFGKKLQNGYRPIMIERPILVSSRRWHEKGFIKTFLLYAWAYVHLWTGIPFYKNGK